MPNLLSLLGVGVSPFQPVAASFFPGMEQAPYQDTWGGAWTLDPGVVVLGQKLGMPAASDPMSSYTNFTLLGGTRGTIDFNRHLCTVGTGGSEEEQWNTSLTGDFDLQMDHEWVSMPDDDGTDTSSFWFLAMTAGGNPFFGSRFFYHTAHQLEAVSFNSSGTQTGGSNVKMTMGSYAVPGNGGQFPRAGTWRLTRVGSTGGVYYLDPHDNTWVTVETFPVITSALNAVYRTYGSTGGLTKKYRRNIRQLLQTTHVTGHATSPVFNTLSGLRRLWCPPVITGVGSGTVALTYRTGATPAACLAAAWQPFTAGTVNLFTASSSNACVQLDAYFDIPAGSASPQVGPFLINGAALGRTFAQQMWTRGIASAIRKTDANHRVACIEAAVTSANNNNTDTWPFMSGSIGAYLMGGNPVSITWEGTTFDLAANFVANADACLTVDNNLQGSCLQYSALTFTALVMAWSVLSPYLTSTQKTNWTNNAQAALPSGNNQGNFTVMQCIIAGALDALHTLDPTHWAPYTDAQVDTYYTAVQTYYRGDGAWDDGTAGAEHFDTYTLFFTLLICYFLFVRPGYHNNATLKTQVAATLNKEKTLVNSFGWSYEDGRSLGSGTRQRNINAMIWALLSGVAGDWDGPAVALANRVFANTYIDGWHEECDGISGAFGRDLSGYIAFNNTYSFLQYLDALGIYAWSSQGAAIDAATPYVFPLDTPGCLIWPETGSAYVQGPNANDCLIKLRQGSYDLAGILASEYDNRVAIAEFTGYVGVDINSSPLFDGEGFYYTVSDLHSNQWPYSFVQPSSSLVFRVGADKAMTWATGNPARFGGGITPGVQETSITCAASSMTDGHSHIRIEQVQPGTHTVSEAYKTASPIPLGVGKAVSSPSTGVTWACEQGPDGRSHFIQSLLTLDTAVTNFAQTQGAGGLTFQNRAAKGGASVQVKKTGAAFTVNTFFAAHECYSKAPMTTATEAARVSGFTQATDWFTYTKDSVVYGQYAGTGSGKANPTIGSYTLTGTVHGFAGTASAAQKFGGDGLTALSFSGTQLLACQTAGMINVDTVSIASTSRAWVTQGCGNVTLFAACLPAGFSKVTAYDSTGAAHDVTASCTITAGVSVVIPASVVSTYAASTLAEVTFDIQ